MSDLLPEPQPQPQAQDMIEGELSRGASIGRYLVTEKLGAGGMGVVYAAYDPELNRKVAIKLLRASGDADGDTQGRVRLLREAQAMAQLSHPNVIAVYDVGTAYNQVFVAMEFVDGGTLADWLKTPRTQEEILQIFHQAGCGLAAAHAAGLIHRDFKPDNTLVGKDGRARVLDFGLARAVHSSEAMPDAVAVAAAIEKDRAQKAEVPKELLEHATTAAGEGSRQLSSKMTQTGALMGTPRYMSPEQFRAQAIDARSDQFSFCVALYEALCGIPPFSGDSIGERCFNVMQGNILPPPPGKRPPKWLHRALLRGLSVAPEARYATMDALLKVLSPEARQGRKRRTIVIASLVAALCVAGGVFGGLRWQKLRAARLCDDSSARIAEVFGPAMKEQAQRALLSTGKSMAGTAWERTQRNVEEYLAAWRTMRKENCQAVSMRARENRRLHDRRMRCLDSLLQEVSAFTSLIAKAEPSIVERVAETSGSFTPVSACADNAALMTLVPERPEMRDRVDALHREAAEVRVIAKLARYDLAQTRAKKALESAQQIGHAPATALALQQLAVIENDNSDFSSAERDYVSMAAAALSGGDHRSMAVAFIELMRLSGRVRKQFDQAERYGQLAVAALSRAGTSERWLADFHVLRLWYKCQIELSQKELNKAEQSCEEALRLVAKVPKIESSQQIGVIISLANVYKREEKFHQALALYQQALSLGEKAYGTIHPNVAVDLYNIGSLLQAQQKYGEAAQYFGKALEIYKRVFGPQHPRLFSMYAALTRSAYLQQHFDEAVDYAQKAQELSGELANATVYAAAACLLGDALYRQGKYDAAQVEHQKAIDRCDPRRCEAEWPYFLIALADDLRALRKSKQALPMLQEALRLLPPTADREVLAHGQFSLAQALYDMQRQKAWARAEELATSALVHYRTAGIHTQSEQAALLAWLNRCRAEQ